MLEKYIVAEVTNKKKDYLFHQTFLEFDKDRSSLILEDDYVKKDIDDNICYLYDTLNNMVKAGIYSSLSSAKRAIKNNVLEARLNIIYITNLEKINRAHINIYETKSLQEVDKYCSAVQYEYSLNNDSVIRYEIYGHAILGDFIERDLLDLIDSP